MSVQNFSFLARLEVAEKFVVVGWGGGVVVGWYMPSLWFSFSQAEQKQTEESRPEGYWSNAENCEGRRHVLTGRCAQTVIKVVILLQLQSDKQILSSEGNMSGTSLDYIIISEKMLGFDTLVMSDEPNNCFQAQTQTENIISQKTYSF